MSLGHIAFTCRVNSHDRAHGRPLCVLFAVPAKDPVTNDQRGNIQATTGKTVVPDWLPRPRLDGPDVAISRTKDECFLTLKCRHRRAAVSRVVGKRPGTIEPDNLSCSLVETNETMSRLGHVAPANNDRANNHQVITNHRKIGPATVSTQ